MGASTNADDVGPGGPQDDVGQQGKGQVQALTKSREESLIRCFSFVPLQHSKQVPITPTFSMGEVSQLGSANRSQASAEVTH